MKLTQLEERGDQIPAFIDETNPQMIRQYLKRFARNATTRRPRIEISAVANERWQPRQAPRSITLKRRLLFNRSDRFFTIGSCFAEEVRLALTARGMTCLPDYSTVVFDAAHTLVDTLPHRQHMNYYNTFSIVQEVERAAGKWMQARDDHWVLPGRVLSSARRIVPGDGALYQDPYRRLTLADTLEGLDAVQGLINQTVADGIRDATAFVITLGLTEVFVQHSNGRVANQVPRYGGAGLESAVRFHASTFAENYANVRRTVDLLREINPSPIVLTVSPVPLALTFSGDDIVVANHRSKATLLTVARQVCEEVEHCHYFPSYEIVSTLGEAAYERDGRHVKREVVERVINFFIESSMNAA